jgi:hypothetical protein
MDLSKKPETTAEDLQKDSRNDPSGLIYWDDYNFDNQSDTAGYLKNNYRLKYDAPAKHIFN